MDPIRQAAILVAALDMDAADALLEQMPDEFAAAVRHQVMELDDVDPAEEQAIIGQFLGKEVAADGDSLELSSDVQDAPTVISLEEFLARRSPMVCSPPHWRISHASVCCLHPAGTEQPSNPWFQPRFSSESRPQATPRRFRQAQSIRG